MRLIKMLVDIDRSARVNFEEQRGFSVVKTPEEILDRIFELRFLQMSFGQKRQEIARSLITVMDINKIVSDLWQAARKNEEFDKEILAINFWCQEKALTSRFLDLEGQNVKNWQPWSVMTALLTGQYDAIKMREKLYKMNVIEKNTDPQLFWEELELWKNACPKQ